MALTATEEAQARQLIAQQAALLSLAGNEATITSKLGATKVNLVQLPAASALADADLLLVRQGTTDKSIASSAAKSYISPIASTAEAQAWTANDKFLTPQRIAEAFMGANRSLTGNGYFRIPGVSGGLKDGHIVQYGYLTNTGATDTITFPITFPNNIFTVLATPLNTVNQLAMTVRSAQTTSNFTVKTYTAAPGSALVAASAGQVGISWIAIGN